MASTSEKILESALSLPEDERRNLAERLLESLPGTEAAHRAAWADEAKRRADEIERGDAELLDLGTALGELRSDLRRLREA